MRHDEANGDENNKNENYLALGLESSPFKSLGGEDSKSRVCTLHTFFVRFSGFLFSFVLRCIR